ncbi:MAG: ATP-binding protein [Muribaculaceae bacterium]|nr:ATP-binding protein [Muribaculaceae bacterium]
MNLIQRPFYQNKIEKNLGKNTIIILTGQRRVGKSFLLRMLRDKVMAEGLGNVIFIDKEKSEFDNISSYQELNKYIENHLDKTRKNFILIDEIQDIKDFEKSLRNYYEDDDVEIVVTGSNSRMLSSDLSTLIGGRYKEIHIFPLSYPEFLEFNHLKDSDAALIKYINRGGLPGMILRGDDESEIREYQRDVYNTALLKDIIMRNEIRNAPFLENLVKYLADNTGKLVSASNISKFMNSSGNPVTTSAILSYLKYLCEAFLVERVGRFDIHGKRLFESNDKYYFEDHGIRNAITGGKREGDIEKVIENIVYSHLIRAGYDVKVGQLRNGEIDFVATKHDGNRAYIQASYIIGNQDTYNREFGNLKAIQDNYPKYVVSVSPLLNESEDEGIRHLHLRKFLMEGIK